MSQGSFNPKFRFLGQKVCSVTCDQTHESEYRGNPFFAPTTYQGSAEYDSWQHYYNKDYSSNMVNEAWGETRLVYSFIKFYFLLDHSF